MVYGVVIIVEGERDGKPAYEVVNTAKDNSNFLIYPNLKTGYNPVLKHARMVAEKRGLLGIEYFTVAEGDSDKELEDLEADALTTVSKMIQEDATERFLKKVDRFNLKFDSLHQR